MCKNPLGHECVAMCMTSYNDYEMVRNLQIRLLLRTRAFSSLALSRRVRAQCTNPKQARSPTSGFSRAPQAVRRPTALIAQKQASSLVFGREV